MKIGLEYIKYRWKAKKRHGIHSPFVYDLTDNCLKKSIDKKNQSQLNAVFEQLRNNQSEIIIQDFGVGSKKLSNVRKVSSIFNTSSSHGKYGSLLFKLSNHYKPNRILELGTSLGVGTAYLKLGHPASKITTLEACPGTWEVANSTFKKLELNEISSILTTFDEYLKKARNESFDLVFVDGHHDGKALLDYMDHLRRITHDQTIFVLDDIRWSSSMLDAWQNIIADKQYHVTLDFFRFGIVIRRPQQTKEHFLLKL